MRPAKPARRVRRHAVNDFNCADDATNFEVVRQHDAEPFGNGVAVFLIRHSLRRVDGHGASVACLPRSVLNVFVTGHDQPSPRLANGNNFHLTQHRINDVNAVLKQIYGRRKPALVL